MPEFVKAIGAARFGVMAGVAAVLTAFFLYTAGVLTEAPKSILFSGLDGRDASAVTSKLDGMNVPYDIKDGGTILVPADQVTKLRMARRRIIFPPPASASEIFDHVGRTFRRDGSAIINRPVHWKANSPARSNHRGHQRACISSRAGAADIFPRGTVPSASVVLKTRRRMEHGQVPTIQHLVAAAVTALNPDRVRRELSTTAVNLRRRRRQEWPRCDGRG